MITASILKQTELSSDLIYHYTSSAICIEKILYNRHLKFSSLSTTHDPLEYQDFDHAVTGINITREQKRQMHEKGVKINAILKKFCKTCCFSIDTEPAKVTNSLGLFHKGFARSRMWSQYSDCHRGVCLVFSARRLHEIIMTDTDSLRVPTGSKVDVFDAKVEYDNYLRKLDAALTIDINDNEQKRSEIERIRKKADAYLFTKLEDYKGEQEYRMVIYSDKGFDNGDSVYVRYGDALQCIILGNSFPEVYESSIKDLSKKMKFSIVKANWFTSTLQLSDR